MGITSTAYRIVLLLHILCAIVGFGTVFLNGIYGAQAKKRPGPGGLAIQEANLFVSHVAEYVIYAVFILGIGLVSMSDDAWKFSQTWVWLATMFRPRRGVTSAKSYRCRPISPTVAPTPSACGARAATSSRAGCCSATTGRAWPAARSAPSSQRRQPPIRWSWCAIPPPRSW